MQNRIEELKKSAGQIKESHRIDFFRPIINATFSPNGSVLASEIIGSRILLCDVVTGWNRWKIRKYKGIVDSGSFSPDSLVLASGSINDNTIRLWDVATGRTSRVFEGHKDRVNSVSFSPDGHFLASGSDDSTIRLWKVETGKSQWMSENQGDLVAALAWKP